MKTLARYLSIAAVVLSSAAAAHAEDPFQAGMAAMKAGDVQTAISKFRDAVDKNKKNPQAYLWLGKALLAADSLDQANAAGVQARELDTANAEVFELLGDVYAKEKIFAGAVDQYKRATELDPKNVGFELKLLDATKRSRKYAAAVEAGLRVLALDSVNTTALTEVSNIYMRSKHFNEAVPIYERLYRIQPDSMNVQVNYVKALNETKQCEKLIPLAEAIVAKDGSQTDVQEILANCYVVTKQISKVIDAYRKLDADKMKIDDLIKFAKALKISESFDSSLLIFGKAYAKDSTRCDIPYDFGTTYMKVKNYPAAIAMFERKIACDTSSGYRFASHLNEAMSLMQLKDFTAAKEHIQKSIEFRPDNITAWKTLAQDAAQLDENKLQIEAYSKVVELVNAASENSDASKYTADLLEAYKGIGIRYLLDAIAVKPNGDEGKQAEAKRLYAQSVEYFKKALALDPKSCQVTLWAAQASQNSGNKDEAKKYYCRVLQNCPNAKEAKDAQQGLDSMGLKCGE